MEAVKTNKSYQNEVKQKYKNDKKYGLLRNDLHGLTPGNFKNICLNFVDEKLSNEDRKSIENFFGLKKDDDLLTIIKKYDVDKFKPICRFLKGNTETIQQYYAIELIAIIINFNPRPYNRYYKTELDEKACEIEGVNHLDSAGNYTPENETKPDIIDKPKNKKIFTWYNTASDMNKILFKTIAATILIVSTTLFIITINSKPNWMVWKDDHYEKVSFSLNKYDFYQLKLYKEERILNFKKIEVNCNTKFFKEDGNENIWYGKNAKGKLEYFTDLGLHPETGKTLKKITRYMIKTHICEAYK